MQQHKFSEADIDFMRQDLASNGALTKIIENTKKQFEEEGRDFEKEFDAWRSKSTLL
jgi:hypothetical protein